jgi:hypothetical protein
MPKICETTGCQKRARYALPDNNIAIKCFEHKTTNMVDPYISKCIEDGCSKYPSYNFPGQKKRIYCGDHKKDTMINIANKKCSYPECKKTPIYNFKGSSNGLYCLAHKKNGMINVVSPICCSPECTKRAHFGTKDKPNVYCSKHKKGAATSSNKTCAEPGCNTLPSYNFKGMKKRLYCMKHKKEGMISAFNNTCIEKECVTRANFNYPNQKKKIYCLTHKKDGMINVGRRLCAYDKCTKTPSHNYDTESSPLFCSEHKKVDMINKIKKCLFEKCRKYPIYNYADQKGGIYCLKHKKETMIDVTHLLCKTPLCLTRVIPKYKGYCLYCFINTYPDEQIARNYKNKESAVVQYIKHSFSDISLVFDKSIEGGCSKKRPDIFIDMGSHVVIVEIDEHQHNDYNCLCENKRMMEISKDIGHRPLIIIRFNPDSYIDYHKNNIESCWNLLKTGILAIKKSKKVEWENRLQTLKTQLEYWTKNVPTKTIYIVHLFYDGWKSE